MRCEGETGGRVARGPLRIAVLAKQVPRPAELTLAGGRLVRDGVGLETNAYCRRANAHAVHLAGSRGEVVVFSMGPPSAADTVREMIACGATRGVLISDPALGGSDTLVTARVLVAAIEREGPFDLVLAGALSLDSDTGHIGVQVAELLDLPFIGPCRTLEVVDGVALATTEADGGFMDVEVLLPTVASAAERLCPPSKGSPEAIAAVPPESITTVSISDLGLTADRVGLAASPTQVGTGVRGVVATPRARLRSASVEPALDLLAELIAAEDSGVVLGEDGPSAVVGTGRAAVWCVPDSSSPHVDEEFVAAVGAVARAAGRPTTLFVRDGDGLGPGLPADRLVRISGTHLPPDWVDAVAGPLSAARPHCVVIEATDWGRELAARLAARLGWGLVGDAVELTVSDGAVVTWKSAFSGQALVPITSRSPTLLVTARPGALRAAGALARDASPQVETWYATTTSRVIASPPRDPDVGSRELGRADRLIVVGAGVQPEHYDKVDELRVLLGAGPLACTRKVTDEGWLPRTRQIGITGRSVAPELIVSIGASGKFNHSVAFSRAKRVLAVNSDPDAPIFDQADVGIVGDWSPVVAQLCDALRAATAMRR